MAEQSGTEQGALSTLSDQLVEAVAQAGAAVVRVEARRRQAASGVVWANGFVVTADHVLERDEDIALGLPDGQSIAATVVGRDPGTDLALLRPAGGQLSTIGRSPGARVGQLALIVARPGADIEASLGTVSALGGPARTWRGGRLEAFVRTDAVFYPGFSGGPLIDADGRMIGLATSHFGQGVGLAIPLATVDRVVTALQSHGRIRRGFVGVGSQPVALPEAIRAAAGGQESGLLIVSIEPGGPAERAGLLIGDVIVGLGGQPIRGIDDLREQLGAEQVGKTISVKLVRGGEARELPITVGERV